VTNSSPISGKIVLITGASSGIGQPDNVDVNELIVRPTARG
jgi:hypothetical protein